MHERPQKIPKTFSSVVSCTGEGHIIISSDMYQSHGSPVGQNPSALVSPSSLPWNLKLGLDI